MKDILKTTKIVRLDYLQPSFSVKDINLTRALCTSVVVEDWTEEEETWD